jgi:hypothetical protein
LVPLLAVSLALTAACSDDGGDGGDTEEATVTRDLRPLTPLEVAVEDPGDAPREVLEQTTGEGATWDGGIELGLEIGDLVRARAVGDTTLEVRSVDEDGTAVVTYTLDGLDVALGTGGAEAGQTTPDALGVEGDVEVAPDRSGAAGSRQRVAASGAVPGAEGLANSLDPRIVFAFLPFPDEPVGEGARWTVEGPIHLFDVALTLEVEVELVRLRGGMFATTAAITMAPDPEVDQPPGIQDLQLTGLAEVRGDLSQLGPAHNRIAVNGTAVFPDNGNEPQPVSLRLEVEQRHASAGAASTS